jgi:hypothetical protein
VKIDGTTAYEKIDFYQSHRDKILRAASDKKARDAIPTKRGGGTKPNDHAVRIKLDVKLKTRSVKVGQLTVDDIESFAKVRDIDADLPYDKMSESNFKKGVARILKEKGDFKDWGGESRDLSTTRLLLEGKRLTAAFAFKGPGQKGRLTPGKMGKNGDQIQRLARCPAQVFIVQYWNEIDDSVLEQLKSLIQLKSFFEDQKVWYGIIDGQDSARLIAAYPKEFSKTVK